MAYYNYNKIEQDWQKYWANNKTFKAENNSKKPKYYVLDMFPYPSGAGLHVGHPLGYIASCIYARYKRLKGFNVLHPMGYDSFGLPAEQYAIQTGQHPAITTKENITRYRQQLDKIGLSFDWDREVRTSDADYYKWTQWIFIQIYNSWYNNTTNQAEKIESLITEFEKNGNRNIDAACDENTPLFSAEEWKSFSEEKQQKILLNYRLTYIGESMVNWCPELGTVLANDEVKDGVSERGGHPVVQKKMKQWSMRISAYAQRLLDGLEKIDWTDSIKEVQRNWIGKSEGASIYFSVENHTEKIEVFTTRPDTIFGASFMVLAPEHELVNKITTTEQKAEVEAYILATSKKSERDRLADVKTVSGAFTGTYAIHPFTGNKIPIWIADYVLSGYGTGAVMAVPCGDERDFRFATHFGLDIPSIVEGFTGEEAIADKNAKIINSDFLNGLTGFEAIKKCIKEIEKRGFGKRKINYRLRDAVFTRQRYWGEPLPVYFKNDVPYCLNEDELPLQLPEVDKYLPTEDGEPPLARAKDFKTKDGHPYETSTMPGWAGSSWYFLRYMDAHNNQQFVSREAADYWRQVDLYIGGAEHGTGHLLYSRFWCKILFDLGLIGFDEPFQKMINQGMIQGNSAFTIHIGNVPYSHNSEKNISLKTSRLVIFISSEKLQKINNTPEEKTKFIDYYDRLIKFHFPENNKYKKDVDYSYDVNFKLNGIKRHADVSFISNKNNFNIKLHKDWAKKWLKTDLIEYYLEDDGSFICEREVEKMSKSKFNVVNPDELIERFGADTLRCYEMFLGPIEQHKPWDTKGIEGTHRFLKKVWNQFHDGDTFSISDEAPTKDELRALHKTIKKMEDDIERYSFNTLVSNMMILLNSLQELKCNKRQILEPFLILLSPMAPHISEELWRLCGHNESISYATFPEFKEEFLAENAKKYPISFNGKMRFTVELPTGLSKEDIEKEVMAMEETQKWLEGKSPKKIIIVPEKIVNIVM